jgi:hypothetical protein
MSHMRYAVVNRTHIKIHILKPLFYVKIQSWLLVLT